MHKISKAAFLLSNIAIFSATAFSCETMMVKSGQTEPVMVAEEPNPRPIEWSSFEIAKQQAFSKQQPFIVFFCPADIGSVAGGDLSAFTSYRKSHEGEPPDWTVFDCPRITAEMLKAGIAAYVKIPNTPENAAMFQRYDAKPGTVALFTPEGEKFTACDASRDEVLETLWTIREHLLDWADGSVAEQRIPDNRFR